MSSDNLTNRLPDDKLDRLIILAEGMNGRLGSLEQKVDAIDRRLSSLENNVASIDRRLTSLEAKADKIDDRLSSLEATVDKRLKETRPIWEAVEERLERIEIDLDKVKGIAHDLRADFRDWRKSVNARLEKLEPKAS